MDSLIIRVCGDLYDFQITITDPKLVEMYRDNPDELRDYFQSVVYDTLGNLSLPKDIRRELNALDCEHQERKIKIIERLRP